MSLSGSQINKFEQVSEPFNPISQTFGMISISVDPGEGTGAAMTGLKEPNLFPQKKLALRDSANFSLILG